ncbi:sugar kinase [Marinobacterium sedimentorum]|uniref:sugar kinase n=1 Tax=Marinobacterium sedimentorum TaxID=2927804 RepID=UPI0020C6967B|nr:sugar kinase [Marinobacterium sedimentorum]MCP8688838.1 sugar kinase [Marinobacterium sedimentorum]
MTTNALRIASIGECMIELAPQGADQYRQGFAGDSYNTAYYLQRLLGDRASVSYVTALGDDRLSAAMCRHFSGAGLDTSLVRRLNGRRPGLYMIENDSQGERVFHYWRDSSAARALLDGPGADEILHSLAGFDAVYLSGISLAILPESARERLVACLQKRTGLLAFDPNFRPALWGSKEQASVAMNTLVACGATVLTTLDDEGMLHGYDQPEQVIEHWQQQGAVEVVVKQGADGCIVARGHERLHSPAEVGIRPIDTTGAGDSFNAGYLAARLAGLAAQDSARLAHRLAGTVIQHRGAIVPHDVTLPGIAAASQAGI